MPKGVPLNTVPLPGSKSATNRALLLAALAPGLSTLRNGLDAEDTRWMRGALVDLGVGMEETLGAWRIQGGARPRARRPLWLGASGTTLRFLLPWLALQAEGPVQLTGADRLFERPLEPLLAPLRELGARWEPGPGGGLLHPCPVPPSQLSSAVDASLSSQFLTGLALAAATLPEGGKLSWDAVASPSYLGLTSQWLGRFGVTDHLEAARYPAPHLIEGSSPAAFTIQTWEIPGGELRPADLELPADWSGAAALICAAAVTGRAVELGPLDPEDGQGDRALPQILAAAGCGYTWVPGPHLRLWGPLTRGLHADLTDCPDLGPVLAATAALAPEPSVLTGLHTLPLKECDRLDASAELVRWLGGKAAIEGGRTLRIEPATGQPEFAREPFNPRADHRMAFAAAVGGLLRGGRLQDPHCVAKTFPDFWSAWHALLER
jgi:3-phosphoshikimate 1-carboxyvinyltransferase